MKNRVNIKLCIGILGVCIISLDGDETDGVFNHISLVGEESWFNALPPHDHPIDGTYEILCDVFFSDNDTAYKIVKTTSSHDSVVEMESKKIELAKKSLFEVGSEINEDTRLNKNSKSFAVAIIINKLDEITKK